MCAELGTLEVVKKWAFEENCHACNALIGRYSKCFHIDEVFG